MAIDNETPNDIESLIESGRFTDETDITDLVAAMNGGNTDTKIEADASNTTEVADDSGKADEQSAAKEADAAKPDAEASSTDDDSSTGEDSEDPSSFKKHALFGVLRGTRQTLAKVKQESKAREQQLEQERDALRRQNQELLSKVGSKADAQAEIQQAADDAGFVDAQGNPVDVATIDIDKLREDYDGPLVEAIAGLQKLITQQNGVIKEMRQRETTRERSDAERRADEVQADIDAVPALAQIQAKQDPVMWDRAIKFDAVLKEDPEWKGKSRIERFQEVARILGAKADEAPPPKPKDNTKAVDDAVQKAAQKAAARAVPNSLSDMPSGTAAGQSEQETLEGLDTAQLANKLAGMSQAQQDSLFARIG